jgi:hypothetical protein
MDEKCFKERSARLEQVNDVIKKLDPTLRAEAIAILRPYVVAASSVKIAPDSQKKDNKDVVLDTEVFFSQHSGNKPSDNAIAVAAFLYGQRGTAPFSLDDIRGLADEVGVTVPDRLDMTFLTTKKDGKSLFRRAGKGQFQPTVHGEGNFKTVYQVSKGRTRQAEETGS